MLEIYIDGSGNGIYCCVCRHPWNVRIGRKSGLTNNEAEYYAVILALKSYPNKDLTIYSDSQLIVSQLKGIYAIREPRLKRLAEKVWRLMKGRKVIFRWVRRDRNLAGKILLRETCFGTSAFAKISVS